MISRVADSCFWLTRYLERVDTWSRLLEVTSGFSLDAGLSGAERWRPLVFVRGQEDDFIETVGEGKLDDGEEVQSYLVWDDNPFSLTSALGAVRENARTIREVMSVEMWEAINETWLWLNSRSAKRLYSRERDAFYQHLCSQCMLVHGIAYSTMMHDDPFTFMKLGRAVERADQTARLISIRHHALQDEPGTGREGAVEAVQWLMILRSCSAYEPFFKRASNVLSGSAVAQFLLLDPTFPRSVLHNLDRARGLLLRLRDPDRPSRSWHELERLRGSVLQLEVEDVRKMGLNQTSEWIVGEIADLCSAIHDEYLAPSVDSLRAQVHRLPESAAAS